jgi:O-antigen/teichoic acid export membrane protein
MLRAFARYGLPLIAVAAGELILSISDRYMIGYFLGAEAVGIYSAGYNIASVAISFLFLPLLFAGFPMVLQAYENGDTERVMLIFRDFLGVYFLVLLPATAGVAFLSHDIAQVALGGEFHEAGFVMPWVAFGVMSLGLSWGFLWPLQLKKTTNRMFYSVIAASFLNIGANLILIPYFGITGAAISTFIAYFSFVVFSFMLSRKVFNWRFPLQSFAKAVAASAGMCLILILIWPGISTSVPALLVKIAIGTIVYIMLILILGERLAYRGLAIVAGSSKAKWENRW